MIKHMKVAPKFDRRKEGLRALAGMVADAYRKGRICHDSEEPLVSEDEIITDWELDGEGGFLYTETVHIEAFLRKRKNVNSNTLKSRICAADQKQSTLLDSNHI